MKERRKNLACDNPEHTKGGWVGPRANLGAVATARNRTLTTHPAANYFSAHRVS